MSGATYLCWRLADASAGRAFARGDLAEAERLDAEARAIWAEAGRGVPVDLEPDAQRPARAPASDAA